jgi:hypothetical protein
MIAALQSAYGRIYEAMTKITPASWIFDRLGSLIVAKPEDMKQAPDFWLDNEDRDLPSVADYALPPIQMEQVAGEWFRRHMKMDLGVFTMLVAMIACTPIYIAGRTAIGLINVDLSSEVEQADAAPGVQASQPAATQAAPRNRTVVVPSKPFEVSQGNCQQLQSDLDQQLVALTTSSIYDAYEACRAQRFL